MNISSEYDRLCGFLEYVHKIEFKPQIAVVLGSGLGEFGEKIDIKAEIPYSSIPGFPISTVKGHDGKYIFGYVEDKPVVVMKGRIHFYEGYPVNDVVAPIRLMKMMGAETLFLSNASGGINKNFRSGDLMVITDHISILVPNPLVGPNINELGPRFPDMTDVYDDGLNDIIFNTAKKLNIELKEGVYAQVSGPAYETPSDIRMLALAGADAVGMSTVMEAIAARHCGMNVCGISCITNPAAGLAGKPLSHKDVLQSSKKIKDNFENLVYQCIAAM